MTVPPTTEPVTEAAVDTAEAPVLTTASATETTTQPDKAPHSKATTMTGEMGKRDITVIAVSGPE